MFINLLISVFLLVQPASVAAQSPTELAATNVKSKNQTVKRFNIPYEKYVLVSNGLTVILAEDHALPIVAVNIWYHAGPINEAPGRTGFAHLFEHLMFQGSKNVGDDQHFKILEGAGASLVNGTTDYDRTNYFETVPSNQLELALWLESDRMGFLLDTLTQAKLDNQREVVKNERRQAVENAPYGLSDEALIQNLFPKKHPYYGNVIGSMTDLSAATLDDVADFYTRYYAPKNASLAIVGDFDRLAAKKLVERYFGSLAARPAPQVSLVTTPKIESERRAVIKEPVGLARIQMAWLTPPAFAPGDADCDILAVILGSGKSSRLYRRLVYDLQIAQSVSAAQESLALGSIFTITVVAKPNVPPEQLESGINAVLNDLIIKAPSEHEITKAKNQILTDFTLGLQDIGGFGGRADMLNRYQQYLGDPGFFEKDLDRYENVTTATVSSVAQSELDLKKRVVVVTLAKN